MYYEVLIVQLGVTDGQWGIPKIHKRASRRYDHISMFPEQLTNVEIILLVTLPLIAIFTIVRLIYQHFFKKKS